MMNKGREGKAIVPSTDLLVCFPSRAHLHLRPKPICSPIRPSESNKHHHNNHHQRKRSISRIGGGSGGGQTSSPMLWTKNKSMGSENSEPTSPKVTCAGQIKVRHKNSACRSWQSVMEEIEKIHNDKKQKKRLNWAESLGFKKEIMQFFTCLRAIRFDLRCFGSFSGTDIATEDEEEDGEDEDEDKDEVYYENNHGDVEESDHNEEEASRTVFSKWFMVLQEEQKNEVHKEEEEEKKENGDEGEEISAPPPNALLLMRCRSAPAKSWLEKSKEEEEGVNSNDEKEKNSQKEKEKEVKRNVKKGQSLKSLMEEENRNKKENLVVMRYNNSGYYGISTDIATETWIVGGLTDPMSRSRSWKR